MKFNVSSSELLKSLNIASGGISPNPVLPIMEDFLFVIKGNELTLSSTNLEITITTRLEVVSDKDGTLAIPAIMLLNTIKALPDQPISIAIDENNGITILSSNGKYNLSGDNADDFPNEPEDSDSETITLSSSKIIKGISNTLFATSTDELRQAMTGVLIEIKDKDVNFVSTDAHKMVKYSIKGVETEIERSLIVPRKCLSLLKNALKENTDVVVSFNKQFVFFTFERTKIICRLIDAKYPNYNSVIPTENNLTAVIDRKDLLNSLKRISIYANKNTNQVILSLSAENLKIEAQDLEFSNNATESIKCSFDGDDMVIGYNGKFLSEMLAVMECEDIHLKLSSPQRAGVIVPPKEDVSESLLMLVMPLQI